MEYAVTARPAGEDDLPVLLDLYRRMEREMTALHPMWPRADGFAEPVGETIRESLEDPQALFYLGELGGYPLGFIYGRSERLLPHEGGAGIGTIRMVFVEEEARGVGIGEALRDALLGEFRRRGHTLFDSHVLPGHRLAKNFFEAGGFSARSIVMHHNDDR